MCLSEEACASPSYTTLRQQEHLLGSSLMDWSMNNGQADVGLG